jgi:hypothetical protein
VLADIRQHRLRQLVHESMLQPRAARRRMQRPVFMTRMGGLGVAVSQTRFVTTVYRFW